MEHRFCIMSNKIMYTTKRKNVNECMNDSNTQKKRIAV